MVVGVALPLIFTISNADVGNKAWELHEYENGEVVSTEWYRKDELLERSEVVVPRVDEVTSIELHPNFGGISIDGVYHEVDQVLVDLKPSFNESHFRGIALKAESNATLWTDCQSCLYVLDQWVVNVRD